MFTLSAPFRPLLRPSPSTLRTALLSFPNLVPRVLCLFFSERKAMRPLLKLVPFHIWLGQFLPPLLFPFPSPTSFSSSYRFCPFFYKALRCLVSRYLQTGGSDTFIEAGSDLSLLPLVSLFSPFPSPSRPARLLSP